MNRFFFISFVLFFVDIAFSQDNTTQNQQVAIIIYGSDSCHYCLDAKKHAEEQKLDFVYFDIDKDENALREMLNKLRANNIPTSNLNLPVVDKNGIVFTNEPDFTIFLNKITQ
ncbi:glutaredoxin family protein [Flavobacterium lacus]|uniref:Glutaredoxin n=1 Tax=Flavobacterium lacus TaxID=1353778 RepID=A0A328WVS5_9FLAO|nr:glutaredoxin family protein [Flavobacterium lacus]RAR50371.1 glutaredoxin [Flavobacterium lacus]